MTRKGDIRIMIKALLTKLRYMLFRRKKEESVDSGVMHDTGQPAPQGINGLLDAEIAFLFDDAGSVVLTVNAAFDDVPAWIEGDPSTGAVYIVQMGGASAKLKVKLPPKEMERWTNIRRIALVTNADNGEKLMHHIAFTLQTRV